MSPVFNFTLYSGPLLEEESDCIPDEVLERDNVFYGWAGMAGLTDQDVDRIFGVRKGSSLTQSLSTGFTPRARQVIDFCKKTNLHPAYLISPHDAFVSKPVMKALKHVAESCEFSVGDREKALDALESESSRFQDLWCDDDLSPMYRKIEAFFADNAFEILEENEAVGEQLCDLFSAQTFDVSDEFSDMDLRLDAYDADLTSKSDLHAKADEEIQREIDSATRVIQILRLTLFDRDDYKPQETQILDYYRALNSGTISDQWEKTHAAVLEGADPKLSGCYDFMARHRTASLPGDRILGWPQTLEAFCDAYADLHTYRHAQTNIKKRYATVSQKLAEFQNWRQRSEDDGHLGLYRNALLVEGMDIDGIRKEINPDYVAQSGFVVGGVPDFLTRDADEN